jgi:hypothetical protein
MTATAKPAARQSRAARAIAQAKTDAARPAATKTAAKTAPKAAAKPKAAPKPKGPSTTEQRQIVFAALAKAAGDLLGQWSDDRVPVAFAREVIAHRMSYVPSALDKIWDPRLGPVPTGRGKIAK